MRTKLFLYKASCYIDGFVYTDYPLLLDYELSNDSVDLYLFPVLIHAGGGEYLFNEERVRHHISFFEENIEYIKESYMTRRNMINKKRDHHYDLAVINKIKEVNIEEFNSMLESAMGDKSAIILCGNYFAVGGNSYDLDSYISEVIDGTMFDDIRPREPFSDEYVVRVAKGALDVNEWFDYIVFSDGSEHVHRYAPIEHGTAKNIVSGNQHIIYILDYKKIMEIRDPEIIRVIEEKDMMYEGFIDTTNPIHRYDIRMNEIKYITLL
ncbi:MAG: hypothetical protein KatS3mg031_2769 [Chitinophagales bacterium]|nr:MAG: hypothetical protein KatS3mg031_2769 [Chitinophagales bacterium]